MSLLFTTSIFLTRCIVVASGDVAEEEEEEDRNQVIPEKVKQTTSYQSNLVNDILPQENYSIVISDPDMLDEIVTLRAEHKVQAISLEVNSEDFSVINIRPYS